MKILLVSTPYDTGRFRSAENLGVKYIASILAQDGHDLDVVDLALDKIEEESFIDDVSKRQYDLVGIGVPFTGAVPGGIRLARKLRERVQIGHLTLGGQGVSFVWEDILKYEDSIDSCVVFEGEITAIELVRALSSDHDFSTVRGLFYRREDKINFTGFRDPIVDLDDLPFPYRKSHSKVFGEPHYLLLTSRGCTRRCTFCQSGNYGNRHHSSPSWRYRSAENVIAEIVDLRTRFNANAFSFIDDAFLGGGTKVGQSRARKISEYLGRELPDTKWSMECRADELTSALVDDLFKGGLRHLFVGIDSGNEVDLRLYGKQLTLEQVDQAVNIVKQRDVSVQFGFIMFHPESSLDSLFANWRFLKRHKIATSTMLTNKLELYPGSVLLPRFTKKGLVSKNGYFFPYRFKSEQVATVFEALKHSVSKLSVIETRLSRQAYIQQTSGNEHSGTQALVESLSNQLVDIELDILGRVLDFAKSGKSKSSRESSAQINLESEIDNVIDQFDISLSALEGQKDLDNSE